MNLPAPASPAATGGDAALQAIAVARAALDGFLASPPPLTRTVALIAATDQPIILLGVGKSGLVAAKLAATFASLGMPAFFVNAAEAAHGDLGAISSGSVVLLLSNSGSTDEIVRIVPLLKARACRLIGLVGRADSPLGWAVDHLVPLPVTREADPLGLAPTASTTLQMAVGDALAVAASVARGFTREDFLRQHPAGLLGRRQMPVTALMRRGDDLPAIAPDSPIADLLATMSAGRIGAAAVVDPSARLLGLVCDGDIRRLLLGGTDLAALCARDAMRADPVTVPDTATLGEVLRLHRDGARLVYPVLDCDGRLVGMLPSGDLL